MSDMPQQSDAPVEAPPPDVQHEAPAQEDPMADGDLGEPNGAGDAPVEEPAPDDGREQIEAPGAADPTRQQETADRDKDDIFHPDHPGISPGFNDAAKRPTEPPPETTQPPEPTKPPDTTKPPSPRLEPKEPLVPTEEQRSAQRRKDESKYPGFG